ncbi:hypothetical protein BSL78_27398 [Apostichopus japonicus]|uniref:SRCR domain-containing protein n=1 Tax=Stichopus japonicus TaxID=307972 RepID=A0A2G8JJ64_STIJA|nr:hypothetical protein BSL78_27398 [Apostichopus japonicus]
MNFVRNTVRLLGGGTLVDGIVEVLYNGSWGKVCDDSINEATAVVVCRQLGHGNSGRVVPRSAIEHGSGTTWLQQLKCIGSERRIDECSHGGWKSHFCNHSKNVGVICDISVRLVGRRSSNEGTVEVFMKDQWGTINKDSSDQSTASVTCRALGYSDGRIISSQIQTKSRPATGPIWLNKVHCNAARRSYWTVTSS